jgi:hypothetical protein
MPAVLVGALFYWAVALGMGSLSLVAVSALSGAGGAATEGVATDSVEDSAAPSGVADDDGAQSEEIRLLPEPAADEAIVVRLQDDGDESADGDDAEAEDGQPPLEPTAVEPMSGNLASGI